MTDISFLYILVVYGFIQLLVQIMDLILKLKVLRFTHLISAPNFLILFLKILLVFFFFF